MCKHEPPCPAELQISTALEYIRRVYASPSAVFTYADGSTAYGAGAPLPHDADVAAGVAEDDGTGTVPDSDGTGDGDGRTADGVRDGAGDRVGAIEDAAADADASQDRRALRGEAGLD